MFAATSTGSTRAPFLPDIANDLSVSLPAVANLFGLTALAWGISSWLVGYASDRVGRYPFLIFSPLCLAVVMAAVSIVQTYPLMVALIFAGGACCGAFTATAMAEVSLRTPLTHQGRALGLVMAGQSMTLLVSVPLSAWLGSKVGWRGIHLVLAGLAVVAALAVIFARDRNQATRVAKQADNSANIPVTEAIKGPVLRLFLALVAERVSFGLAVFYYAAFLRTEYGIPIESLTLPLVGFAAGNIAGTLIGGQIADRFPYRRIAYAIAISATGVIAIPWFSWPVALSITIWLGVAYAVFNGIARPPLLAALADVPPEVRGVVMGLNSAIASIGWMLAAFIGGWLYSGAGFGSFSPLMAGMCLLAALIVLPDSRLRQQNQH